MSEKPTIVLLPGLDGTGRLSRRLIGELKSDIQVHSLSYPQDPHLGHAELVRYVLGEAPDRPYAIVAESFSGPIAVLVGTTRPQNLRGIILSASFVVPPAPGVLGVMPFEFLFRLGIPRTLLRWLLLDSQSGEEVVDEVVATIDSVPPFVLGARVREILRSNVSESLRSCAVPVVFLSAGSDRLLGSRSLRAAITLCPGVATVTIGGPHLLFHARPVESAAVIRQYIERWFAS